MKFFKIGLICNGLFTLYMLSGSDSGHNMLIVQTILYLILYVNERFKRIRKYKRIFDSSLLFMIYVLEFLNYYILSSDGHICNDNYINDPHDATCIYYLIHAVLVFTSSLVYVFIQ